MNFDGLLFVFRNLGDIFGRLTALCQVSFVEFSDWLVGIGDITYINLYNGFADDIPHVSGVLGALLNVFLLPARGVFAMLDLEYTPLWIALLVGCVVWGAVLAVIRMFVRFIKV